MYTVPTETALKEMGDQILTIDTEPPIDLNPENEVPADELELYTEPTEDVNDAAPNTTAWD